MECPEKISNPKPNDHMQRVLIIGPHVRLEQRLIGHENKIIRLQNPVELQRWMDSLPNVA